MARSVTYSIVPRYNPSNKEAPARYYAQAQARGDVSIREMSERIQKACTVTKADVYATLVAMEDIIIDALKDGEIVRLGDLGSLQIGLSGKGADSEEDYDVSLIKKARINFRPGTALSGILPSLTYTKVAKRGTVQEKTEETTTDETTGV